MERSTRIRKTQISEVAPSDLEATNSFSDNQVPSYDLATGKFTWVDAGDGGVKPDGSVNPNNLFFNGNFEDWSGGISSVPDGWVAGASAHARESTIIKLGTYSMKLTGVGCTYQNVAISKGINYWKNRKITFSCWVYTTVANSVCLLINDGSGNQLSSYHSGSGNWELLTKTITCSSSASQLNCGCYVQTGAGTVAYFDGAIIVEGESIFAFSDKPAGEGAWVDYSAVSTIIGWSSFTTKKIYIKKIGKIVFVSFYLSGTSNSTTTSFTLPYINAGVYIGGCHSQALDNGSILTTASAFGIPSSSLTVTCWKDMATTTWTASNTKYVLGAFWYESI